MKNTNTCCVTDMHEKTVHLNDIQISNGRKESSTTDKDFNLLARNKPSFFWISLKLFISLILGVVFGICVHKGRGMYF